MTTYWNARTLHDELASFYSQYRGIPAPANTYTESLWGKIEEVEAQDAHRR